MADEPTIAAAVGTFSANGGSFGASGGSTRAKKIEAVMSMAVKQAMADGLDLEKDAAEILRRKLEAREAFKREEAEAVEAVIRARKGA